jgi:hypothetical protein
MHANADASPSTSGSYLQAKAFKTTCKTAIRTLPSALSLKLGDLPQGWKVAESTSSDASTSQGWIAIEPRGYVLAQELVPSSPLRRGEPSPADTMPPRTARRSICSAEAQSPHDTPVPHSAGRSDGVSPQETGPKWSIKRSSGQQLLRKPVPEPPTEAAPARSTHHDEATLRKVVSKSKLTPPKSVAQSPRLSRQQSPSKGLHSKLVQRKVEATSLLALKEEHVQLRESNLGLRERELEKRVEVEELVRAREAIAAEVRQLELSRQQLQEQSDAERQELERQQQVMKDKLVRCRDAVAFAVGSIDELYSQQEAAPHRRSTDSKTCEGERISITGEGLQNAKALAEEAGDEVCQILESFDEDLDQENTDVIQSKKVEDSNAQAPAPDRTPLRSCNSFVSP